MSSGPPRAARVAGLVLAAGAGRRYGGPKALVRLDGRLLIERAIQVATEGGCGPVVAVLGAAASEIRDRVGFGDVVVVENLDWATGMGSSLRAGLAALAESDAVAAVVLLVDMPGVTAEAVGRLLDLAAPDRLALASYGIRRGHPVLLGRSHWPGVVESAVGDVGARAYLRRHAARLRVVPCDDIADDADLDRPPPHTPG